MKDWTPPPRYGVNDLVPVCIAYTETELKKEAKAVAGKWDPEEKVWFIQYGRIKGTSLEKHIVSDATPKRQKAQKHIIV